MKLKLTNRERILIIIAAICLVAALFFNLVIMPQLNLVNQLEKQANEYSIKIKDIKAKASLENPVYEEYEALSAETKELLFKYYPEIIQEKIILLMDEKIKNNNLSVMSIAFTEPGLENVKHLEQEESSESLENQLQELVMQLYNINIDAKNAKAEKKAEEDVLNIEKMTVSLSLTGNYEQIYGFIKDIEQENKSIICSNLNITNNLGSLTCDIILDFYAVPKPFEQDDDYLNWNIKGEYGKENPF